MPSAAARRAAAAVPPRRSATSAYGSPAMWCRATAWRCLSGRARQPAHSRPSVSSSRWRRRRRSGGSATGRGRRASARSASIALRWAIVTSQASHVGVGREVGIGPQGGEERLGPGVVGVGPGQQGPADPQDGRPVLVHDLLERSFGAHRRVDDDRGQNVRSTSRVPPTIPYRIPPRRVVAGRSDVRCQRTWPTSGPRRSTRPGNPCCPWSPPYWPRPHSEVPAMTATPFNTGWSYRQPLSPFAAAQGAEATPSPVRRTRRAGRDMQRQPQDRRAFRRGHLDDLRRPGPRRRPADGVGPATVTIPRRDPEPVALTLAIGP